MRNVALLLCLALASFSPATAQPASISFGIIGKTSTQWPWYVADKIGLYKKRDLNISLVTLDSAASAAQQLSAGALNVAELSSTIAVQAINGGAPIKYVINDVSTAPYTLLTKNGIQTVAQLKGKTIIVGGSTDITRLFFDTMAKAANLKPDDYTLVYAGATNARFAALKSGSVDAALLLPPFSFLASDGGYQAVTTVQKSVGPFPFVGIGANASWVAAHPDQLVALTKVYLEAVRWLYDPANRAEAITILAAATNSDPGNTGKTYDEFITQLHAFSQSGMMNVADMRKVIQALVALHQLDQAPPPDRFIDNDYARRAATELAREK